MKRTSAGERPAILGDGREPAGRVPVSQPTLPDFETYASELRGIFETAQITNARWVETLERRAAEYLGVREVIAMANATSGLVLSIKVLGLRGTVALPSFTFPATLHALLWNGLRPRLLDCDPETFNLSLDDLERVLAGESLSAVAPVYIFGNSPDWDRLTPLLRGHALRAFSDAAHALGTRWGGAMAGSYGDVEIFSLAPTKVTVAGEGGLLATNDAALARELRIARNYGNPGDYDCVLAGLNARMSELHALLAALSLEKTEAMIERRHGLAGRYREALGDLPGIGFQKIDPRCRTTFNYLAIRVDPARFGLRNAELKTALAAEGIESKIYFAPPLHRQSRFLELFDGQGPFPGTEAVLSEVLCLPLFSHMSERTLEHVAGRVRACHEHAEEIRARIARLEVGDQVERLLGGILSRPVRREEDGTRALRDLGLSSLKMIQLIGELEETFDLRIEDEEVGGENFGSIESLIRFLEGRVGRGR
jgi:dTDP-4-amino-4,6-dideoxygalactose transaminase/acyl carrier protein